MRTLLIRCYPARWRARYGDEFEALLEMRPLGPFDVADILLGALDAQLRLRGHGAETAPTRRFTVSLRIGGLAAIVGASLFVLVALMGGFSPRSSNATTIGLLAAIASLLLALTGMSAFQARTNPALVWTAFGMTAVGTLAIFIAGIGELTGSGPQYWQDGPLGVGAVTAALGSAAFGIATYRGSVLSRRGALALVIGPAVGLSGAFLISRDLWEVGLLLIGIGIVSFLAGWVTLGVAALRLDGASALRPA